MLRELLMRKSVDCLLLIALASIGCAALACGTTAQEPELNDASADANAFCHYDGGVYQVGDIFGSGDTCSRCTCLSTGQVTCTTAACFDSANADTSVAPDGITASDAADATAAGDAELCCPADWSMYACVYLEGGMGLACHNPAQGCASSNFCGMGCDRIVSGRCDGGSIPDAAARDGGCVGTPPTNSCGTCNLCVGGSWICGVTQCPPSVPDAGVADAQAMCGGVTCAPNEWCDTSQATPTCRCGLVAPASCAAGLQCCVNPLSGCAPAHCNEYCATTCPN